MMKNQKILNKVHQKLNNQNKMTKNKVMKTVIRVVKTVILILRVMIMRIITKLKDIYMNLTKKKILKVSKYSKKKSLIEFESKNKKKMNNRKLKNELKKMCW